MMKTSNILKSCLISAALFTLISCGPATYDAEAPEESSLKILEELSQDKKMEFNRAVQKILLREMARDGVSLLQLGKIASNPELGYKYTRCMHGKTADEIIAMANEKPAKAETLAADTPEPEIAPAIEEMAENAKQEIDAEAEKLREEADKYMQELDAKVRTELDSLDDEEEPDFDALLEKADAEFDAIGEKFEQEIDRLEQETEAKLDAIEEELDLDSDDLDSDLDDESDDDSDSDWGL